MEKEFTFKNIPTDIKYIDAWNVGIKDGLFYLAIGSRNNLENNQGDCLFAFVMNPDTARLLLKQIQIFLEQPPQPPSRI
jgi:hypothetical protein